MADPIVVSQLIKKRSELAGLADAKRGELNAILRDLDHLDAVIKLFAPEGAGADPGEAQGERSDVCTSRADAADLQYPAGS
jgi:hypothetical protein